MEMMHDKLVKFLTGHKLEIPQEYINSGDKENCTSCPIALTLTRDLLDANFDGMVRVMNDNISITFLRVVKDREYYIVVRCQTPQTAQDFIHRFDNNMPVEPTTIVMPRLFTVNYAIPCEMEN